jgi:hypothetical protein
MSGPPLVDREMRVAARRWTTYWTRVMLVILTVAPAVPYYALRTTGLGQIWGPTLLLIQAYILFFWLCFGAIQLASDAIAAEKREGTLGLLFLTDLSAFDIVAGKLAACSLRVWHGLLAVIPALGLPILLGGVTMGDCLRLALILGNVLFVTLTGSLVVSCLTRREYEAGSWSVFCLAVLLGAIPLIQSTGLQHAALNYANLVNPIMPLRSFMESHYQLRPDQFWTQLGASHALGWVFLALSCLILPRVWQDRISSSGRGFWRQSYEQWLLGAPRQRRQFRAAALPRGAMFWYANREHRLRAMPWIVLGGIALVITVGHHWPGVEAPLHLGGLLLYAWIVQGIFKSWIAGTAARVYAGERQPGALELVLVTSLTNYDLVTGPLRAMARRFLGPVLFIIAAQIVLAIVLLEDWHDSPGFVPAVFLLNLILFPLDVMAVAVVGLWKSVVSKNASHARSGTAWWVLLMPWMCTLGIIVLAVTGSSMGPDGAIFLLFIFSLIFDIGGTIWAWNRLETRLRETALERSLGGKTWQSSWRWLLHPEAGQPWPTTGQGQSHAVAAEDESHAPPVIPTRETVPQPQPQSQPPPPRSLDLRRP